MADPARGPALAVSLVPEFGGAIPSKAGTVVRAVVSLKAAADCGAAPGRGARLRLQLVLDVSGSMAGSKMELMKQTTKFLIDQAGSNDMLGITTYEGTASTPLPLQRMLAGSKELAQKVASRLGPGGGTALYAGLEEGIRRLAAAPPSQTAVDAVFLCTDGEATDGPRTLNDIEAALTALKGSADLRIPTIHCFGFGDGHDSELLEGIADAHDGQYSFLRTPQEIPTAFADILGGLLSCTAKDIQVRLSGLAASRIRIVRSGGRVAGADAAAGVAGDQNITFSDMYAEEARELLVEMELGQAAANGSQAVLQVDLEYTEVSSGQRKVSSHRLSVERSSEVEGTACMAPHELIVATAARYATADAITAALAAGHASNFDAARQLLTDAIAAAAADTPKVTTPKLLETLDVLQKEAKDMLQQMTHRQAEFRTPASRARYGKAAKGFVQQRQGGGISSPHAFRLYDTVSKGAVRVSAAKYCTPAGGAPVKAPRAPKAPKAPTQPKKAPAAPSAAKRKRAEEPEAAPAEPSRVTRQRAKLGSGTA